MPFFHRHTWVEEQRQVDEVTSLKGGGKWYETFFLLRCSECGQVKSETLKGYFPKSE